MKKLYYKIVSYIVSFLYVCGYEKDKNLYFQITIPECLRDYTKDIELEINKKIYLWYPFSVNQVNYTSVIENEAIKINVFFEEEILHLDYDELHERLDHFYAKMIQIIKMSRETLRGYYLFSKL